MKKFKQVSIFFTLSFILMFLTPNLVFGFEKTIKGLDATKTEAYGKADIPTSIPSAIGTIVGAALAFVGVLFFILFVYGGILWMTARGNDQQIEKAKDLIISAIFGLVIILSSYAVTAYIGGRLTNIR